MYHDIPIWGQPVVYDTPQDAIASLSEEEKRDQFVRLIRVANNRQLKTLLEAGKELCAPKAELYIRVSSTCPLYWITWEMDCHADGIEIVSQFPGRATRSTMLHLLSGVNADNHPVVGRVCKRRKDRGVAAAVKPLVVAPGACVVRDDTFVGGTYTGDQESGRSEDSGGSEDSGEE